MNANLTMKLGFTPYRYFIAKNLSYNLNKIKSLFSYKLESLRASFFLHSLNFHENLNKISTQNSASNLISKFEENTNEKIDESIMKITTHKRKRIKMKKQKKAKRRRETRNSSKGL